MERDQRLSPHESGRRRQRTQAEGVPQSFMSLELATVYAGPPPANRPREPGLSSGELVQVSASNAVLSPPDLRPAEP